jgi:hypothetical protein
MKMKKMLNALGCGHGIQEDTGFRKNDRMRTAFE